MAYRDRYDLEPLRVRAWLRSGVVADRHLPLDGILLYQNHRDALGALEMTVPGEYTNNAPVATLPLGILHPGHRHWYYQCSWAQWSHEVEGQDYWNKRFRSQLVDLVDFDRRRGKVIIEQGKYKAYHMPVLYRAALWIEWYCIGDKKEIEHFLSTVTHLGKKAVQGWGRVARWQIEPWSWDWSVWRSDGRLMRGIPPEDLDGHEFDLNIGNYGIRPSYWKRDNQMTLVLP